MNADVLWGAILILYIVLYGISEIYRQAVLGNAFSADKQSILYALGLIIVLGLWGVGAPPGFAIIALVLTALIVGAIRLRAAYTAARSPAWLVGIRRISLVLGILVWVGLFMSFYWPAGTLHYVHDREWLALVAFPIVYGATHFAAEWALRGFSVQPRPPQQ
jgi:hypothetical protein